MCANRSRWLAVFACSALSMLTFLDTQPGGLRAQGGKKKPDPDVTRYTKQLLARFKAWDRNDDNVLDKAELARAFRGAGAKPFDYEPETRETPVRRRAKVMYAALVGTTMPLTSANLVQAALLELRTPSAPPAKGTTTPNYNTFPDYQFLVVAGTKGQTQLTRKEFEAWARNYARLVDGQQEAKQQYQQAKARFDKAKTAKGKQQAEVDMRRHTQELQSVTAQLNAIPQAIHKALNLKR
ncbi:MAG: hypothetical protein L0Z62_05385 [Gemmataceae bacterium]|nr:hypothetical protein [Gemmataceae bacterium]